MGWRDYRMPTGRDDDIRAEPSEEQRATFQETFTPKGAEAVRGGIEATEQAPCRSSCNRSFRSLIPTGLRRGRDERNIA
jgi:hypothetical protein